MPDVQEVFRMATQKVRPEPGFVDRQFDHQRRRSRNRRNGAIVVVAALVFAGAAIMIRTASDGTERVPGGRPTSDPQVVPEVDYVLDLDTGTMTPLPDVIVDSVDPEYAAMSPDRSAIAYVAPGDDGNLQIFVANLDGTGGRQLTNDRGAYAPAWSPDGTTIAYEGYGDGSVHNLFVVDVATGATSQVTTFELVQAFGTQFSPDGATLVYAGGDKGLAVRTVPVAGGRSTLLVGPGPDFADAGNGSLSPDGTLLSFAASGSTTDMQPDRWVSNADGSDPRLLVEGGAFLECIPAGTWSPDGTRIVCSGGGDVVVIDVATGGTTTVADGSGAIWVDDHSLLIDV
jgi:dipeptidyl aminopeptidase/acylaminoacyl peptidase